MHFKNGLTNLLLNSAVCLKFDKIATPADFYVFSNETFLPNVYPEKRYNGDKLSDSHKLLVAGTNMRYGTARIIYSRVKDDACYVPKAFENLVPTCYGSIFQ